MTMAMAMGSTECENLNGDGRKQHVKGDSREAIPEDNDNDAEYDNHMVIESGGEIDEAEEI